MELATDLVKRLLGPHAVLRAVVRSPALGADLAVVDLAQDPAATRLLLTIDGEGRMVQHSSMSRRDPERLVSRYEQLMAVAILIAPRHTDMLLLGLGGGALWRHLRRVHPECRVAIVEKSPEMVAMAREWFDIDRAEIVIADAAAHLAEARACWDVIAVDLYDGTGFATLPPRFWDDCRARLAPEGTLVVNWAEFAAEDRGRAAAEQLAQRFAANLFLMSATRESNCIQICARTPLPSPEQLRGGVLGPATLGGRRIALENVLVSSEWPALPPP